MFFKPAVALILMAPSLACAADVTLLCETEGGGSFTLKVDYTGKTVSEVKPDGTLINTSPATITEGEIAWDKVFENVELFKGRFGRFHFAGQINRLSGNASVTHERVDTEQPAWTQTGHCNRATQKF
ncbi:MAG TPA: hypothetical protein VM369_08005 [Candidatus Binatia bacterium]|nr:hypothetical protein [Candidatus Binatia bacterium]